MPNPSLPEIKFLGPRDFEEMDIPPVLYKYRNWDDRYHRRIVKERENYFARPDCFKDPLYCHIPLRYDLITNEDILNKYRNDLGNKIQHGMTK